MTTGYWVLICPNIQRRQWTFPNILENENIFHRKWKNYFFEMSSFWRRSEWFEKEVIGSHQRHWKILKFRSTLIKPKQWGGAGIAQWWEHSPLTKVARVWFPDVASNVGWVCWFSTPHREVFSGNSGFSSPQKPKFDLIVLYVNFCCSVPN